MVITVLTLETVAIGSVFAMPRMAEKRAQEATAYRGSYAYPFAMGWKLSQRNTIVRRADTIGDGVAR